MQNQTTITNYDYVRLWNGEFEYKLGKSEVKGAMSGLFHDVHEYLQEIIRKTGNAAIEKAESANVKAYILMEMERAFDALYHDKPIGYQGGKFHLRVQAPALIHFSDCISSLLANVRWLAEEIKGQQVDPVTTTTLAYLVWATKELDIAYTMWDSAYIADFCNVAIGYQRNVHPMTQLSLTDDQATDLIDDLVAAVRRDAQTLHNMAAAYLTAH